jgi:hypothetical protein
MGPLNWVCEMRAEKGADQSVHPCIARASRFMGTHWVHKKARKSTLKMEYP